MKIFISGFLAKSLIEAYQQLKQNSDLSEWNTIPREDVFSFIREVTGKESNEDAIAVLEKYYNENPQREAQSSSEVPAELENLVRDYEEFLKNKDGASATASRNKFLYDLDAIAKANAKAVEQIQALARLADSKSEELKDGIAEQIQKSQGVDAKTAVETSAVFVGALQDSSTLRSKTSAELRQTKALLAGVVDSQIVNRVLSKDFAGVKAVTTAPPAAESGGRYTPIPPMLKIAAVLGGKELAKGGADNSADATAKAIKFVNGYTADNLRIVAQQNGVTNEKLDLILNKLERLDQAFPLTEVTTGLTGDQLKAIFGPGDTYSRYETAAGQSNIFVDLGQRFLGKYAAGFLERSIRRNLVQKAEGVVVKKAAQTVFGVAMGVVSAGLFNIANWLALKIGVGIRSKSGTLGAILGGLIGLVAGGPVGLLVGGAFGGAIGGIRPKKLMEFATKLALIWVGFVVGAIAIPLAIALIGIPILIIIILFIINSGAYVVPPSDSVGLLAGGFSGLGENITSPYVDVVKTASPAGPFQNSDLPQNIRYRVTVRAKKGSLTNIKLENKCQVYKKRGGGSTSEAAREGGISSDCEHPLPTEMPGVIDPGAPYVFEYGPQTYNSPDFEDAFVVDTFKVTADALEKNGAVAASSAVIKIGNPPEDCPVGWPVPDPIRITQGPQGTYSHVGYEAIDISKDTGTEVRATHAGVVIADEWPGSYGHHVRINSVCNGKIFQSVYAHMNTIAVQTGTRVGTGEVLGTTDDTGRSDAPHLHYEFRPVLSGANDGPVPASQQPIPMAPPFIPRTR